MIPIGLLRCKGGIEAAWTERDVCMTSNRLSDKLYRTKAGFDYLLIGEMAKVDDNEGLLASIWHLPVNFNIQQRWM